MTALTGETIIPGQFDDFCPDRLEICHHETVAYQHNLHECQRMTSPETDTIRQWFENAVLGLGLCPFAGEPWREGRVRIAVTQASTEDALVEDLHNELTQLAEADPSKLETTILGVPHFLQDFDDYNQFLNLADAVIEEFGWTGRFQIASFHPDYQFAETQPDDVANLTNRSPYPLLHLLRESSISKAVDSHPDVGQIPNDNIATLESLSDERRQQIFGFLNM